MLSKPDPNEPHIVRHPSSEKICWICYFSESDDEAPQRWIRPCRCCGSSKWVHQSCLHRWIDEKQQNDPDAAVACRICGYNYVIEYPQIGVHMVLLELFDRIADTTSTYCFAGGIVFGIYWSAVTYGALTVMQIFGHEPSIAAMERIDPGILFIGLPAIPTTLIFVSLIGWQDRVLQFWRQHVYTSPYFKFLGPRDIPLSRLTDRVRPDGFPISSVPRVLCSALSLPTFALLFGRLFFHRIDSHLGRTLAGGALYIFSSGLLGIYHKEARFLRSCRRRVIEFNAQ